MIILSSGESLQTEEVYEAMILLSRNNSIHPLITSRDKQRAMNELAQDALDFEEEGGLL